MKSSGFNTQGSVSQYDGFRAGEMGTSVNLFYGDVLFDYPLVDEMQRDHQLGIEISASYSSNTDKSSRNDNREEPTGVLGLGWKFGYSAIFRAEAGMIRAPEEEIFYYRSGSGLSQLYQTTDQWLIAKMGEEIECELIKESVSEKLALIFAENGIAVTAGSEIRAETAISPSGKPSSTDGVYILIDFAEEQEIRLSRNEEGEYDAFFHGILFETSNFDFSRIVYFPRFEKWLIVQKDGIRKIFGGTSNQSALQYVVHYGGMLIPSNCQKGQRAVRQWNLSRELSVWDDEVTYNYWQINLPTGDGDLTFTKECYLWSVKDSMGYSVVMHYGNKQYTDEIKEYIDPINPSMGGQSRKSDCWQSRYETKYLESIETFDPSGKTMETIAFDYQILTLYGYSSIKGACAKRILKRIVRSLSTGAEYPLGEFQYYTGQASNLGGMSSILTSTGAKVSYCYAQKQLKNCSSRNITISKENYTDHFIWNSHDYSAILLYNNETSLFRIYSWVGRFQCWTPEAQPFAQIKNNVGAIILDEGIVLYFSSKENRCTKVIWYRKNPDILGGFTTELSEIIGSENCSVYAGSDWVIVYERDTGKITRYTYNLLSRETTCFVQNGTPDHYYHIAPNGNKYILLDYDLKGISGNKKSSLSFFARDGYGNWNEKAHMLLPELSALENEEETNAKISLYFSCNLCAAAFVHDTDSRSFYYDFRIWKFPYDSSDIIEELLKKKYYVKGTNVWDAQSISWEPVIQNSLVLTGGNIFVFDGGKLYENTYLNTNDFDFSNGYCLQAVGNYCVIQSCIFKESKKVLARVLRYDPETPELFEKTEPVCIMQEKFETLNEKGYVPSINGNTAIFDRMVYDLSKKNPFDNPICKLNTESSISVINGGNFIAYPNNEGKSFYIRMVNGILQSPEGLEGSIQEASNASDIFSTEMTQSILLYINTGDGFEKAVSYYPVSEIKIDDGISVSGKIYHYNTDRVACDDSGRRAKYYQVDVYNGMKKESGFTRYEYCNSLAGVLPTENANVPYALDGWLKCTSIYDRYGVKLSENTFHYEIVRRIANKIGDVRNRQIYGAVLASSCTELEENGVNSKIMIAYDPFTGDVSSVEEYGHNVFGDKITTVKRIYPAAVDCPELIWQNRLSEKGRTLVEWTRNNESTQIAEAKAVAYTKTSGRKRSFYTGTKMLRWNGKGDPHPQNMPGRSHTEWGDQWTKEQEIYDIDCFGNIVGFESPVGVRTKNYYSKDGFLCIGNATSLNGEEAFICTFENYEDVPKEWSAFVTDEYAIAGSRSLKISANSTTKNIVLPLHKNDYAVSFWSSGDVKLIAEGSGIVLEENAIVQKKQGQYNIYRIRSSKETDIKICFENSLESAIYVDLFSVSVFTCPPIIHVYKNNFLDVTASGYGEFTKSVYDRQNYVISTVENGRVTSLTIPFYSRLSKMGNHSIQLNSELFVQYSGESLFLESVPVGEEISLSNLQGEENNFAAYVDVKNVREACIKMGKFTVSYKNKLWTLSDGNTIRRRECDGADGSWFLYVGKMVLFFYEGEYVFDLENINLDNSEQKLKVEGDAVFSKLLYGQGISAGIRYIDAGSRIRQGQMFAGDAITVTQNFYDDENRLCIQTKPVDLKTDSFGYIEDFAVYDQETKKISGRVSEAYPEDQGFPYVSQAFEESPYGRKIESGLPGKVYAMDPSVSKERRNTLQISYEKIEIPGVKLEDEKYHYIVTTTINHNKEVSVLNEQKQQVAFAVVSDDKALISASTMEYNYAESTETNYMPAYFSGNKNAIRIKKYDFSGKLISKTDPNKEGETKYCYDVIGKLRFLQTPVYQQENKFLYQKYDALHRVMEEGICYDQWDDAKFNVDDPCYPTENCVILRRYEYGDTLQDLNTLSNLCTAQTFDESGCLETQEYYRYDDADRIIEKTIRIEKIEKEYTTRWEYDNAGNVVSTINSAGQKVLYLYDSLGRKIKEKYEDEKLISEYEYNASDLIRSVKTDNGTTEYGYSPTGWIQSIKSPQMKETIQYTGTRISEFLIDLHVNSTEVPSKVRYKVTYDGFGRLSSALCFNGDSLLEKISLQNIQYDENGNILSMKIGDQLQEYFYQAGTDRLSKIRKDQKDYEFGLDPDGAVVSAQSKGIEKIRYAKGRAVYFRTGKDAFSVVYDTAGNRVAKIKGNEVQNIYLYNQGNRISEEISCKDGRTRQYLYGQFGVRSILDDGVISDIYTDHLGSPRVIEQNGKIVSAAQYTPLGESMPITGDMPFGFNGFAKDEETGLYFSSYRLYDPEIGRFYSCDVSEHAESPYIFCGNDPINRIDPVGDSWWGILIGAVVGIIGIAATVATAGACFPSLLASGSLGDALVGAVSGTVGSVCGTLTTAACDKEPITGKMVLGSLVSGAIAGVGVIAGPMGQMAMRTASIGILSGTQSITEGLIKEITLQGVAIGCTVGAAGGLAGSLAYSAITDTPVSGVSIAMAGLSGMGTGLLSTRAVYGLVKPSATLRLPVMMNPEEIGTIRNGTESMNLVVDGQEVRQAFMDNFGNTKFFNFIDDETFKYVGKKMLENSKSPYGDYKSPYNVYLSKTDRVTSNAIIATHGFGRHCFVICKNGSNSFYRPIKGSDFVNYFSDTYCTDFQDVESIKLFICFSGCRPGSSSTAQKFANKLRKTVYATRGVSRPEEYNQIYLTFQPQ